MANCPVAKRSPPLTSRTNLLFDARSVAPTSTHSLSLSRTELDGSATFVDSITRLSHTITISWTRPRVIASTTMIVRSCGVDLSTSWPPANTWTGHPCLQPFYSCWTCRSKRSTRAISPRLRPRSKESLRRELCLVVNARASPSSPSIKTCTISIWEALSSNRKWW